MKNIKNFNPYKCSSNIGILPGTFEILITQI